MASGNINLVNDVLKVLHGSGHKIDQVNKSTRNTRFVCKDITVELYASVFIGSV